MLWRGVVFITHKNPILSFSYWLALSFSLLNTCVMYFARCPILLLLFKGAYVLSYTVILCTQRVNELKMMVHKVLLGKPPMCYIHIFKFLVCVCNKIRYLNLLDLFKTSRDQKPTLKIEKQFVVWQAECLQNTLQNQNTGFFGYRNGHKKGPL